jgi:hypothetical protein
MHEVEHIPLGGTSHDFTAVVDLSPAASRDSAGVRLAGTSGAESKYVVEGANVTTPAFGTVSATIVQEFSDGPDELFRRQSVIAHARPRVHALRALRGAPDLRLARAQIDTVLPQLGQCFVDAPTATYRVRRKLALTLQLGADGRATLLRVRGPGTGDRQLATCLESQLGSFIDPGKPGARLQLDLIVWMQY